MMTQATVHTLIIWNQLLLTEVNKWNFNYCPGKLASAAVAAVFRARIIAAPFEIKKKPAQKRINSTDLYAPRDR